MLAFLIAIPAVALLGTNLPDTLRQLAERHLGISFNTASAPTAAADAPLNAPPLNPGSGEMSPPGLPEGLLAPPQISMPASVAAAPVAPGVAPPGFAVPSDRFAAPAGSPAAQGATPRYDRNVVPAGYNAPAEPSFSPAATDPFAVPKGMVNSNPTYNAPPSSGTYTPVERPAVPAPAPVRPSEPVASGPGDSLPRIQQRLHELGATYSLLESWGAQGQLYRFYCKVAVGGNANYTRYFEATDADPVRAMNIVLEQVEAWRGERL
jgi:hypothetical protein